MSRTRKIALVVVFGLAALGAGVWAAYRQQVFSEGASDAATLFFAQTLPDAEGTPRKLSSYRGRLLVVNFWATWCAPCVEEIPAFSRLQSEYGERVQFVGIGIDTPGNIAAFERKVRPAYPLLVAGAIGTDLARAFGDAAGGLPFTIVLGQNGDVKGVKLGRVDEPVLRGLLAPLVRQ